jgi:GTP-binding protein Era
VPTKKAFYSGRVALTGRANAGKSTLLNAIVGEKIAIVSQHPQTTRQRLLGILTDSDGQIVFVDTPGVHQPKHRLGVQMVHEAAEGMRDVDAVVLVADARAKVPDFPLLATLPKGVPTICALNKIDVVEPKERLMPVLEAWMKAYDFAAIVPISAKTKSGVQRLVHELRERMPEGEAFYAADTLTDKPVRFMVAEFVREQILLRTREEVPHGIAVTVDTFDEDEKKGDKVALTIHVVKESHKKIVVGKGGAMLKAVGIAARRELERLLGHKVHLKIWVRVTPDWVDDPNVLGQLIPKALE